MKIALTFVPFVEVLDAEMRERKGSFPDTTGPVSEDCAWCCSWESSSCSALDPHLALATLWRPRYPGGCAATTLLWFADLPCKVGLSSYSQLSRCPLRSPCCLPDHVPTSSEIPTTGTFVSLSLRFPILKLGILRGPAL